MVPWFPGSKLRWFDGSMVAAFAGLLRLLLGYLRPLFQPTLMPDIIVARDIVKRYGTFTAVDGVSFAVRAGECFGFLGPNGAGKTTIIRMINCVSPLTAGELTVDGMDVRRQRPRLN